MDMITSGFNFEDYKIVKYCGYCTGECVLGTGFLSSLESGISDFLGMSSGMYENKLMQAKSCAIDLLKQNATNLGGNAIIGVDIDYTTFSNDLMGVIANGTAVVIQRNDEQISKKIQELSVNNYYVDFPLRPVAVTLYEEKVFVNLAIKFMNYGMTQLEALKIKIKFYTVFADVVNESFFTITSFKEDGKYIYSNLLITNMRINDIQNISGVFVEIIKYKDAGEVKFVESTYREINIMEDSVIQDLRKIYGDDVITSYMEGNEHWRCLCGTINEELNCKLCKRNKMKLKDVRSMNDDQVQYILEKYKSARELQAGVVDNNLFESHLKKDDIMKQIEMGVRMEQLYGASYLECVRNIMKVISE